MKNYDELTKDLLERRDRYFALQKKKRVMGAAVLLCCCCIVAGVGIGAWSNGGFGEATPEQTLDDAIYTGIKDCIDENDGAEPDLLDVNNKIVVNQIENGDLNKMNIALMCSDFVEMSYDEMVSYYGLEYAPTVPLDLKAREPVKRGIYKRNGGTGDVYWDEDVFEYQNEDCSRAVTLTVDKGSYVFVDYYVFHGNEERSVINNVEVMIGIDGSGCYYSEFLYNGVGFLIWAEGLSEAEFVDIVSSVIK